MVRPPTDPTVPVIGQAERAPCPASPPQEGACRLRVTGTPTTRSERGRSATATRRPRGAGGAVAPGPGEPEEADPPSSGPLTSPVPSGASGAAPPALAVAGRTAAMMGSRDA